MLAIRKSEARGHADHGWLKSHHSFSFADYYDPRNMGFRSLRVINEDFIAAGMGFPTHPHRDMEIITYVIAGQLQHRDSMGTSSVILPGEVQHMSAGTGVRHSEYNPDGATPTHLLQIWIMPDTRDAEPRYGQRSFTDELAKGAPVLVVSKDGRDGSLPIHQDANLFVARPTAGRVDEFGVAAGRGAYVQVVKGALLVNGAAVVAGDAVAVERESTVRVEATEDSEYLFFDLN